MVSFTTKEAAKATGLSLKSIRAHHARNGIGRLNRWGRLEFTEADIAEIIRRKLPSKNGGTNA